jgi:hypothetical protein
VVHQCFGSRTRPCSSPDRDFVGRIDGRSCPRGWPVSPLLAPGVVLVTETVPAVVAHNPAPHPACPFTECDGAESSTSRGVATSRKWREVGHRARAVAGRSCSGPCGYIAGIGRQARDRRSWPMSTTTSSRHDVMPRG